MNEVLEEIVNSVLETYQKEISKLNKEFKEPSSYKDAQKYSLKVSDILKQILRDIFTTDTFSNGEIYYGTAKELILPLLEEAHKDITAYSVKVQTNMYKKINVGLKPIKVKFSKESKDRAYGIIDQIAINSEVNNNG